MVLVDVPDPVRRRALANGRAGQAWLEALLVIVAELSDRWGLTVGSALRGGTSGYVAAATDATGLECVLKVAMPLDMDEEDAFGRSVEAHQLARGRGCAMLLDFDVDAPAMLLERLGPNLDELGYDVPRILEVVATTLQSFWRPVDTAHSLPTGADKAVWLANYITLTWTELGQPCSRRVIDRAISYCADRAASLDPASAVLVDGDAHGWNTLSAGDGAFKFVDAEGLVSEPAHDLAVAMREYNQPLLDDNTALLTRERAELLATWCEIDPEPVWEWGFIERVATGLANVRDLEGGNGPAFLEVAERCV